MSRAFASSEQVKRIFWPQSIAIVGASERNYYTRLALRRLEETPNVGVHLVNRSRKQVMGRRAYAHVIDIQTAVDLVFVAVPAAAVLSVLEESHGAGARAAIVVSAGFSEARSAEGRMRAAALRDFCDENDFVVCGPSCLGMQNVRGHVSAYGGSMGTRPGVGPVAVISQSGGTMTAILEGGASRGLGFSYLVSSGGELSLRAVDYLKYFLDDDSTSVVCCFIEQFRSPELLIDIAEQSRLAQKPIIALKLGRSQASSRVAAAHTGAITGVDEFYTALFRKLGIMRVTSVEDMLDAASYFAQADRRFWSFEKSLGVVSISGGMAGICADLAQGYGWSVPTLSKSTVDSLSVNLATGVEIEIENPIELSNQVQEDYAESWGQTVASFASDPQVGALCVIDLHRQSPDRLRRAAEVMNRFGKPIVFSSVSPSIEIIDANLLDVVHDNHLAHFRSLESCLRGLSAAADFGDYLRTEHLPVLQRQSIRRPTLDLENLDDDYAARAALAEFGVQIPAESLATTAIAAGASAGKIGFPVVLKAVSREIEHRARQGLVKTGLMSEAEVVEAAASLINAAKQRHPYSLRGVAVQRQVRGLELFVGVNCAAGFAPLLVVGRGGVDVEARSDIAMRVMPVTLTEIFEMLSELRIFDSLLGIVGRDKANSLGDVIRAIARVADFACSIFDGVSVMEVNPLIVGDVDHGVWAVDCLIRQRDLSELE